MGADEKADDIVLAGDGEEDSILVAWLAFGFWHQSLQKVQSTIYKVHALSIYLRCPLFFVLNFTWGLPCQKEDDAVCSQS